MRIEQRSDNGITVLEVKENRIDARASDGLKQQVSESVNAGAHFIVLDLSAVEFVDSSGLGAIVSGLKLLGLHGDLVISGATGAVATLFRLTRMDKIFRMFPTAQEAVEALASRESGG